MDENNVPSEYPEYPEDRPAEDPKGKHKKKKKRRRKHYFLRLMIVLAVLACGLLFARSDFFNVSRIEVEGNRYYTEAQIAEMSQIETGKNIFSTKLRPAKDILLQDPYIKLVKLSRKLPSTIKVDIIEREEYAAVPYGSSYVLIDDEGMVLRITEQAPKVPVLEGMTVIEMTPGKALSVEENYLFTDTLEMLAMMDENDLYFKRINFSAVIVKAYIYDDLYCEGTPSNIRDNMGNVKQLMEELYQEEVTRGVIKVGRDNYISFSPRID